MIKYVDYDIVFQEIPNEVTLAINLSCCPHHCKGCHSPQLQQDIGIPLTEATLTKLLDKYGNSITCLCFMGGDKSPETIAALSEFVHTHTKLKTAWYSGSEIFPSKNSVFDYVKLGSYIEEAGNLRNKTTNQKLYRLEENQTYKDITYMFW